MADSIPYLRQFLVAYENDPKSLTRAYLEKIAAHVLVPKEVCEKNNVSCSRPYNCVSTYIGKTKGRHTLANKDDYMELFLELVDYYRLRDDVTDYVVLDIE